jgi:hypothetical protein
MGTNSNYALRLPASLKQSVEQLAKDDGTSLNQFIVTAVAEKLSAIKTAAYFTERAKSGNLSSALAMLNRSGGEPPQMGDEIL